MLAQIDLEGGLEAAWADVATFVPKLLGFFVILLLGYLIAKALSKAANALLERVGFDGWVERGALQRAFAGSSTDASDVIGLMVFWLVFLVTLQLAFGLWGPNAVSELLSGLIAYLPNVIAAVLILVIAAALARALTGILEPVLAAVQGGRWIAVGAGAAVMVVGVFAALDQLQIAPAIVNGLFYALLAVMAGSALVAFGVGGIPVARRYLERWTMRAASKVDEIKREADPEAGREAAQGMREHIDPDATQRL